MKKTATQLLLLSREWQLAIDSMLHSAVEQEMDPATTAELITHGASAVNSLRGIEEQIHISLGYSYTIQVYNPSVEYIKEVGLPQIEHAGDVKDYYITRMNEILEAMTEETDNSEFLGDAANANQRFEKSHTHVSQEANFNASIGQVIDALEADVVDNS